jgi:hypothetical protein
LWGTLSWATSHALIKGLIVESAGGLRRGDGLACAWRTHPTGTRDTRARGRRDGRDCTAVALRQHVGGFMALV